MTDKKQCSRCGECCVVLATLVKGMNKDDIEFLRARGLKEEQGFFVIPHRCQHLMTHSSNNPYKATCVIHDNKPKTCRNFKGKKSHAGKLYYVPVCCTMKE